MLFQRQTRRRRRIGLSSSTHRPLSSIGRAVGCAVEILERRTLFAGTWSALTNLAPNGIGTMELLSDGTVMAQGTDASGVSNNWYRLTPDSTGSYQNGAWTTLAPMNLQRLYMATNVLQDGRVLVLGGEYSGPSGSQNTTNLGEIYNPLLNTWSAIANFPQSNFGDDPTAVLPDGKVLAGYIFSAATYIFDPTTPAAGTWSPAINKLNGDRSDEETWVRLPDGSILSYNIFGTPQAAQRFYQTSGTTGTWVASGTCPVQLHTSGGKELGPALRLPDGRIFFIGATNHNALYTPSTTQSGTGSWVAAPDTPGNIGANDAPGAMLPNGHVLYAAGDTSTSFNPPTTFEDFDPIANTITAVTAPGGGATFNAQPFITRMLMLPSGQILFSDFDSQLYLYTPTGAPDPTWTPQITNITNNGSNVFTLTGTQLNGISEGASYGDDAEMSTNYPIVRITDSSGVVKYARTFNWSSTGVATGSTPVTVQFTLPAGVNPNAFLVNCIANGIASPTVLNVQVGAATSANVTLQPDGSLPSTVDVVGGATTPKFALSSFSSVIVSGDGANDTITLKQNFSGRPIIVNNGSGTDVIDVEVNGAATTLNGGSGSDTYNFSSVSQNLGNITGLTTINGGAGAGSIAVFDGNNATGTTYTVTSTSIARTGFGGISYGAGTSSIALNGGSGGNIVNINSTAAGAPVSLNAGAGTDTINVNQTNATAPVTILPSNGSDAVNINTGAVGSAQAIFAATQRIGALTIASGGKATVTSGAKKILETSGLSITGTGVLDMTSSDLIVHANAIATVFNLIKTGFNAGTWTGAGVTSSSAATNASHLTALGVMAAASAGTFDGKPINTNDVLVKYTYYGDADLSGTVDGNDYSLIDTHAAKTGWQNGDFNYDTFIDGTDYTLIDNAFNLQGANIAAEIAPAAEIFTSTRKITNSSGKKTTFVSSIPAAASLSPFSIAAPSISVWGEGTGAIDDLWKRPN